GVTLVPLPDVAQKTLNVNRVSFFDQLLISPMRALLGSGGDEHLHRRIGEHDGSHVTAVGDEPGRAAKGMLAVEQRRTHPGSDGYLRRIGADLLAADRLGDVAPVEENTALGKGCIEA